MKTESATVDPATEELLSAIVNEFTDRLNRGERPSVDEYVRRHERFADVLRQMLEPIRVLRRQPSSAVGSGSLPSEVRLPDRLGDFRILREVGRGGMGVVYEAVQESLGRRVALKVLPVHAVLDPTQLARFRHEAQAAARLHHTNIVPVFGVGDEAGVHYFAMQFIDGQGLDEVLRELMRSRATTPRTDDRNQTATHASAGSVAPDSVVSRVEPSSLADSLRQVNSNDTSNRTGSQLNYFKNVARIGVHVAEALAYAHSQGIQHRDIKPSNMLLDGNGTIWVTDFGLAKAEGTNDVTRTGDIVGTLRYLAPERFRGQSDLRSDIYSLGLTLYEMLALRPAFDEPDRSRLIAAVTHSEPPRPRSIDRRIPRDLETIVLKAIAKEPSRRYQTAAEFGLDLRRHMDGEPIRARRSTLPERVWLWSRRNPLPASLAATLAIVFLGGFVAVASQWWRAERNLEVANQERGRAETNLGEANIQRAAAETNLAEANRQRANAEQSAEQAEHERDRAEKNFDAAERQRRRAQQFFRQARTVVDDLVARGQSAATGGDRGTQPNMRELLERARAYYEGFIELAGDDPAARAELAASYVRLGDISKAIGSKTDALVAYQKALEISRSLREGEPASSSYQEQVAATLIAIGWIQQVLGDYSDAEARYVEALSLWEELVTLRPANRNFRAQLAATLDEFGRLRVRQGQPAQALQIQLRSLEIREQLANEQPQSVAARSRLARGHLIIGQRQREGRQFDSALEHFGKALGIAEPLAKETSKFEHRILLAALHNYVGDLYLTRMRPGDREESLAAYERSRQLGEALLRENPTSAIAQNDLANTYLNIAQVHFEAGDYSEADPFFGLARELCESLVRSDPDASDTRNELARVWNEWGRNLSKQSRWEEAFAARESAVLNQRAAVEKSPQVQEYQGYLTSYVAELAAAANRLAWHLVSGPADRRDPIRALPFAEQAVEQAPGIASYRNTLGVVHYRLGRFADAIETLNQAVGMNKDGATAFDLFFLATSHYQLGDAAQATEYFDKALDLCDAKPNLSAELREFRAEATTLLGR